jgi:hypothetical protein
MVATAGLAVVALVEAEEDVTLVVAHRDAGRQFTGLLGRF